MTKPNPIEIRPVTIGDWVSFYGEKPERAIRGFAGVRGDEVLGIAGLQMLDGQMMAFSEYTEEAKKYPVSTMKMAKKMMRMIEQYGGSVFAIANPHEATAKAFLKRLGFAYSGSTDIADIYKLR